MTNPVQMIYDYLDAQNQKEVNEFKKPPARFRLSELGDCPRRIAYRHGGTKPMVLPGFINLYGQDGDIAHDSVRWLMKNAGVELDGLEFNDVTGEVKEVIFIRTEVEHKGQKFTVSGRCDGLIKVEGEWMPLEIKSVDGFKAKYINKAYNEGNILEYLRTGNKGKYRKYLTQMEGTMQMLGYDKAYLVMKDRSLCGIGQRMMETDTHEGVIIHKDNDLWEDTLDMAAMVTRLAGKKELPMRLVEGSYECGICQFRDTCGRV